jgi:DNA replication protein DnaC
MYGTNGTGKTRMAYELAKKCVPKDTHYSIGGMGWNSGKKERPAIYTTAVNLFMEIKDTFRPDSEQSELSLVKKYTDAGLLVLDEIQEKGSTQFEDRKITQIVDSRYMHERPTILIANYSRNEFAESLSPAILDRIRENGCGLYFDWESYRNAKCHAK